MSNIEESVEIDVPVSTAYNQFTQFEEFPRFMDGVERVEQLSSTLTRWTARVAGVDRQFDAEITEQIPDERVAWSAVAGDIRQAGVATFHRLSDNRSKVMLQLVHVPQGATEILGDKLGFVRRRVIGDLAQFRVYIEKRGRESGGWRGTV
ncbi:SRPBCC family protein [Streptomyces otsuchiensis]|uniref:SRPBCC family protein n=1 Tax=Streptomyces otsuchiensis TaxID=2681388 RepID=UPI00103116F7|nr:SRPBCC family protein [Streptomyces otsuchiensis]